MFTHDQWPHLIEVNNYSAAFLHMVSQYRNLPVKMTMKVFTGTNFC